MQRLNTKYCAFVKTAKQSHEKRRPSRNAILGASLIGEAIGKPGLGYERFVPRFTGKAPPVLNEGFKIPDSKLNFLPAHLCYNGRPRRTLR